MNKKFLLFAIVMIVGAWGKLYAQEDITNTYLQNADLSTVDNGWTYYSDAFKYTDWKTDGDVPVVEFYSQWNSGNPVSITQKDFKFSQTVTLPAGDYRLAVNAFYRNGNGDGTNADKAWIFVSGSNIDKKQNVVALTSAGVASYTGGNDLYKAANAFSRGDFSNAFDFSIDSETEVEIGFQGFFNLSLSWCILGPVKLYKYSLEAYLADYRAKVAEANELLTRPMSATTKAALQATLVDENTLTTSSQVNEQISIINEAMSAAQASVAIYEEINAYLTYTQGNVAGDYSAVTTKINSGDYETSATAIAEIKDARNAIIFSSSNPDLSKLIDNAGFELGNTNYWTVGASSDTGARSTSNATYEMSNSEGEYLFNTWWQGIPITQNVGKVPAGQYVLSAVVASDGARIYMLVNDNHDKYTDTNNNKEGILLSSVFTLDNEQDVTIGVVGGNDDEGKTFTEAGYWWYKVDDFKISRYVPVTDIAAENITVELAQTASIEATVTPDNASFPEITYTSANEEIATVDANGVVTGVAEGSTTITLKADEIIKEITITVVPPAIVPESITLDPAEIALQFGTTTTATITASVLPADANQEVTFASSDESIVTVDATGNVTATGIGTATITVTSKTKGDVTATASVTVTPADAPASFAQGELENRDYWIKNAATGMYLGGANNWGTRASLIEHGIPFKAAKADEGIYTLDSYTSNGGNSHFLAGEWIDGNATNLTIQYNDNGTFSIGNGTNWLKAKTSNTEVDLVGNDANDPFAQWYFLSMDDRINMLEEGEDTDATFFIKDFNLSRNNTQYAAWEKTAGITNAQNPDNNGGANHYNWNAERYHATFNMSQTITLPNGTYKLTAQGFYRQDGQDNENLPVFFANDQETTFPVKTGVENSMNEAAASFSKGLYKIEPITVEVNDHTLKIGAKNDVNETLWCIWDNFELEAVEISDNQSIDVQIGITGYATLYYSNLNLKIPEGITAFVVSELNGRKLVTQDVVDAVPAGHGVILNAPANTSHSFNVIYEGELPTYENMLLGTDERTVISEEGYKYYKLSTNKAGDPASVGLYFDAPEGKSIDNRAHKAYLAVPAESTGVNAFLFENADGIRTVIGTTANNGDVYTFSGTKVNGKVLTKGVYIVDGKKVVIK